MDRVPARDRGSALGLTVATSVSSRPCPQPPSAAEVALGIGSEARKVVPSTTPEATDLKPLLGLIEPKPREKFLPD